jgi:hypothetical protein
MSKVSARIKSFKRHELTIKNRNKELNFKDPLNSYPSSKQKESINLLLLGIRDW